MKKLINKYLLTPLLLFGVLLAVTSPAIGAELSKDIPTATATNLITGPLAMQQLEMINNHPSATVTIKIYDAPSNLTTWTNGAYASRSQYTTNLVTTWTNYNGIVTSQTNSVLYIYTNEVAAAAISYKLLKTATIAAWESSTWTPLNGVYYSYVLLATNNQTNVTYNITYSNIIN